MNSPKDRPAGLTYTGKQPLVEGEKDVQARFDQDWRDRAIGGNPEAVRLLAEAALEPLYRFCFYRVGKDHALCEEVVQETMTRAIHELERYNPARLGASIFGWLTGLARNEIRKTLSRNKAVISLEALWTRMDRELLGLFVELDSRPFSDELLAREETREVVNATMSQLPPQYQQALQAKYVEGRSVREMAARTNASEKAVESQLTRAREAFRGTFLLLTRNLGIEPSV